MIIITGATGFIGRRVIKQAVRSFGRSEILCLTRDRKNKLEDGGRKILRELKIKTHIIDLVTGKGLKTVPKLPELVIHLAANPDTNLLDHQCNDIGTKNLFEALSPLGPNTHFVHISTMVAMSGRRDCSRPFNEREPLAPSNEYTRSKERAEKFLIDACKKDRFRLTILRPNTVYGSSYRKGSLIDFVKKLVKRKSILARFNWPGLTSLVYVEDVAYTIVKLAKKLPKPGSPEIYYIHGENLTLAQICALIHKALGATYQPIILPQFFWRTCSFLRKFIPLFEKITSPRIYNFLWRASIIVDHATYCETKKLSRVIPWKPHTFEEMIREII